MALALHPHGWATMDVMVSHQTWENQIGNSHSVFGNSHFHLLSRHWLNTFVDMVYRHFFGTSLTCHSEHEPSTADQGEHESSLERAEKKSFKNSGSYGYQLTMSCSL